MTEPLVLELQNLREEVSELRMRIPTTRILTVTDTDPATSTFTVEVPGAEDLPGLWAAEHFMPAQGDEVRVDLFGATPVLRPGRIAAGAVGELELAPEFKDQLEADLESVLTAANGKNMIIHSESAPTVATPGTTAGDSWFRLNSSRVVIGSWEWDGDSWEPLTYGDAVLASLTASKIVSDTINANLIIAGQVATAASGQRAGIDALGHFAYDSTNTLSVRLDGVNNLIRGQILTGLPNTRRVVIGASGASGEVRFESGIAGKVGVLRSFSVVDGVEAVQMYVPVAGASGMWNGVQVESDEEIYLNSKLVALKLGGAAESVDHAFIVAHVPSKADVNANLRWLLNVNPSHLTYYTPTVNRYVRFDANGDITFTNNTNSFTQIQAPEVGNFDMSSRLRLVNTRNVGVALRAWYDGLGGPLRLEVRSANDSQPERIWAAGFDVTSDPAAKIDLAPVSGSPLDMLRASGARLESWKRKPPASRPTRPHREDEPEEPVIPADDRTYYGFDASQVPEQLQVQGSEGLGVDVYGLAAWAAHSTVEVADRLDELAAKVARLEKGGWP